MSDALPARSSRIDLASQVGIGLALAFFALQGLFEDGGLRAVQDHVITHSFSARVVAEGAYPRDFVYPLPAVVLKLLLGLPGLAVSSVMWSLLSILSVFASLRAALILLGRDGQERAWVSAALGLVAVIYFVQWDLRAVNSNSVYLALVLWSLVYEARGRSGIAGGLLASAVALKLYGAVILLHLVLRGRWRELAWAGAWLLAYFVAVPILYFGPADALKLTGDWLANVLATSDPAFLLDLSAYKVSLSYVMLTLSGAVEGAGMGQLDPSTLRSARLWTRAAQVVWLVGLGGYLWRVRGAGPRGGGGRADLIDCALLLITMLFLSPFLQPHHGVVLLASAVVLADAALDGRASPALRWSCTGALVGSALAMKALPPGLPKALGVIATLLLHASALVALHASKRR